MAERNLSEDVPDARGKGQLSSLPECDPPATGSSQGGAGEGQAVGGGDAPPKQTPAAPGTGASAAPATAPARAYIRKSNYESVEKYDLDESMKRRAFIISNANFERPLSKREFAEVDLNKLRTCLKQLGFSDDNTIIEKNLTARDMMEKLKVESQREADYEVGLFMCFIMTHGEENVLYGVDRGKVPIDKVTQLFNARKCPKLAMKPKVFVIQACHEPPKVVTDSVGDSEKVITTIRIPSEADFLLLHSWVPGIWAGDVSFMGSWFIRNVVGMLNKHAKKTDLQNIFQKVILEMSRLLETEKPKEFQEKKKQVPYITSTLLRKIVFPCKYD